jgi:hypothetical protein
MDALSLVLTIARLALLVAGVVALAVWATRQPDGESALLKRLTGRKNTCADE